MCTKIKEFFLKDWTCSEKILLLLCFMLIGMIKGFFLAPIKGGFHCGCDNGNTYCCPEDLDLIEE